MERGRTQPQPFGGYIGRWEYGDPIGLVCPFCGTESRFYHRRCINEKCGALLIGIGPQRRGDRTNTKARFTA